MENNHNFQKDNSDNFRIICVLGFWCLSPLEVSTNSENSNFSGHVFMYAILTFIEQEVEMEITLPVLVASRSSMCSITFLISC